MKLVSYYDGSTLRPGILVDDQVVTLSGAVAAAGLGGVVGHGSVKEFISATSLDHLQVIDRAAARIIEEGGSESLAAVRLGPPIADPQKILAVGLNYNDHVDEAKASDRVDQPLGNGDPVLFAKFPTSLVGHGEDIVIPAAATDNDWEGELAVVIGRTAKRVAREDALSYVGGYMVSNDVTSRALQYASPQWTMGKGFDTSAPVGPALVTADEIPDPQSLDLTTTVNGETMQVSNTSLMIHPVDELIAYISSAITLLPGDIILTGTPSGVGAARRPMVFLFDGDTVTVSISGLGELTNVVRDEVVAEPAA